jgi:hypothetical protein
MHRSITKRQAKLDAHSQRQFALPVRPAVVGYFGFLKRGNDPGTEGVSMHPGELLPRSFIAVAQEVPVASVEAARPRSPGEGAVEEPAAAEATGSRCPPLDAEVGYFGEHGCLLSVAIIAVWRLRRADDDLVPKEGECLAAKARHPTAIDREASAETTRRPDSSRVNGRRQANPPRATINSPYAQHANA